MKECMTISIDPELEKKINDAAWRLRLNRSAFVCRLVIEGIEKLENEKTDQTAVTA